MGRNGIGMRDVDHSGEQLWHSQTRAAAMLGQPQGAETGALQCGNLVKWVLVVQVSVRCASADLVVQVRPFGRTGQDASHMVHGGHGTVVPTRRGGTHCFGSPRT